jgi:hypothetical protein
MPKEAMGGELKQYDGFYWLLAGFSIERNYPTTGRQWDEDDFAGLLKRHR